MPDTPLIVTPTDTVRTRLEQIAAAAGVRIDHCDDVPEAGPWLRCPLIILDASVLGESATATLSALPKRDGVVVVSVEELTAQQWRSCVSLGVDRVLMLGDADAELTRVLADCTHGDEVGGGCSVAVIGACGGAGATILSIGIAIASRASGTPTMLCDLDPCGAGLEVVLGLEGATGAGWSDIDVSRGRLAADALHGALPAVPGAPVPLSVLGYGLRHQSDVDVELVDTVVDTIGRSGELGVFDLPRTVSPTVGQVVARAQSTVLVTTADVRGCFAAARAAELLGRAGASLALVVRGPSPGGVGADDISAAIGVPLVAAMRPQPGLDRAIDAGLGVRPRMRTPLLRAARAVLRHVEGRR